MSALAWPRANSDNSFSGSLGGAKTDGALLVGVEKVSHLVSRCKVYEVLYRTRLQGEAVLSDLERSLVRLYTVILQFLATATAIFAKGDIRRASHAVLKPDEVVKFIDDCKEQELSLEGDASNCERVIQKTAHSDQTARLQSLLDELRAPLVRIDARVEALLDRSDQSERCQMLQWASDIPYESNHSAAKSGRTEGTAEWISKHPTFCDWRASSASTIIWLHGIRKFLRLFLLPLSPVESA